MDSERLITGTGDSSGIITLSEGLWLCSTTFNTIRVYRFSDADFHFIIGEDEYLDPTVARSYRGSGSIYLVKVGDGFSSYSDPVDADVELAVAPLEARSAHEWELYCNRVRHRD